MANVQLYQPTNLTAPSNLGAPRYGWSGDWMVATYACSVRVALYDKYGNDSGFCDTLKITRSGAVVLDMSGFTLDANGDWAEVTVDLGDLRPLYARILIGNDAVTGSPGADVVTDAAVPTGSAAAAGTTV